MSSSWVAVHPPEEGGRHLEGPQLCSLSLLLQQVLKESPWGVFICPDIFSPHCTFVISNQIKGCYMFDTCKAGVDTEGARQEAAVLAFLEECGCVPCLISSWTHSSRQMHEPGVDVFVCLLSKARICVWHHVSACQRRWKWEIDWAESGRQNKKIKEFRPLSPKPLGVTEEFHCVNLCVIAESQRKQKGFRPHSLATTPQGSC